MAGTQKATGAQQDAEQEKERVAQPLPRGVMSDGDSVLDGSGTVGVAVDDFQRRYGDDEEK
ncbi:hypothetical protein [Streptomyces sp. NPDC089919]|uniref:hypothetical protein n=1 Tax=Streptomyces sp. NPDC089919 TaxID=3155188 RepID=UPI00343D5E95